MTRRTAADRAAPAERESRIRRGAGRRVTAARYRRPGPAGRASGGRARVDVFRAAEGNWTVDEHAPGKSALSYFPTKLAAIRHALQVARSAAPSELRVLDGEGAVIEACEFHAPPGAPDARSAGRRRSTER
jgi:hypothetical protein